jgi:hypothetical protein
MGVCWTGIRHDVEASRAESFPLEAKHLRRLDAFQCELEKRSIRGEPVKTGDTWPIAPKFMEKTRHPFLKVAGVEICGVGGWTLDDVCETDSEAGEFSVVLGTKVVSAERSPHAVAQPRLGERGPEPVRGTREVVSSLNRVQPGIDADEHELKPWAEIVW